MLHAHFSIENELLTISSLLSQSHFKDTTLLISYEQMRYSDTSTCGFTTCSDLLLAYEITLFHLCSRVLLDNSVFSVQLLPLFWVLSCWYSTSPSLCQLQTIIKAYKTKKYLHQPQILPCLYPLIIWTNVTEFSTHSDSIPHFYWPFKSECHIQHSTEIPV